MRASSKIFIITFCLLPIFAYAGSKQPSNFNVIYSVNIEPQNQHATVAIKLTGDILPSKLVLHINPNHHIFSPQDNVSIDNKLVTWQITGTSATLNYRYLINKKRSSGKFDAHINEKWAILRSDQLIPPISTKASKHITSIARLDLHLPIGWSSTAPYEQSANKQHSYILQDPGRRLIRPKGWLLLGEIVSRQDTIQDINVRVASPSGQGRYLQDTMTFINFIIPELTQVFPDFPKRLLVVQAKDPMWLGGLSGTASLFMHADRPLISGNRTSSLLHELIHVAMGITGDDESDWIVEGLAEFYALNLLFRAGGISDFRYQQSVSQLKEWGAEVPSLLVKRSSGAVTARAVGLFHTLDEQIRKATSNKADLDNVVKQLAMQRGEVTLSSFAALVEELAGKNIKLLDRALLSKPYSE